MAAHLVDASRAMPTAAFVVAPALSWMPSNGQRPIAVPSRRAAAREDRPQGRSHGQAAVVALALSSIALARQGGMGSASRRRRQAACRPATVVAASGTRDRSWEALSEDLKERPEGRRLLAAEKDIKEGTIPHTDAKVRYFSESREKPRVVLYRDTAAWCPYCQKVWLLLEAKQVDYITEKVNMRSYGEKTDAFMRKVPRGILPAVEIDGKIMTESLEIMFTLDKTFQDENKPMFPTDPAERSNAVKFLELERAVFGSWCNFLFRPEIPFIGGNSADFTAALQQVEKALERNTESPWFLPYQHPTIVDMQYVSHVERMVASAHYYK
ncbi:unnamed protein product, partial [Polarella glacialis]